MKAPKDKGKLKNFEECENKLKSLHIMNKPKLDENQHD